MLCLLFNKTNQFFIKYKNLMFSMSSFSTMLCFSMTMSSSWNINI